MKGNVNDYNSRGGGISPKRWRLPQAGAEFPESVSHSTLLLVETRAILQWGRLAAGLSGSGLTGNRENWG